MDADELYGLPLERFVPERGALAKALRAEGRREEAAEVASLRKPSVAAWAVNQLVRTQRGTCPSCSRRATSWAARRRTCSARRGEGRTLRRRRSASAAAVDALLDAARGLLTSDGHELSSAVIERVGDTLQAAALDEGARARVRDGRLERELRHQGLGLGEGMAAAAAPAAAPPRKAKKDAAADQRRKAARSAEAQARRRAERAAKALQIAEERRDRAAAALEEADSALEAAREEARAAAEEHGGRRRSSRGRRARGRSAGRCRCLGGPQRRHRGWSGLGARQARADSVVHVVEIRPGSSTPLRAHLRCPPFAPNHHRGG